MDGIYRRPGENTGEYLVRLRDAYVGELGLVYQEYKPEIDKIAAESEDAWADTKSLLNSHGFDDWTLWLLFTLRDHEDESVH